jgi:Ca2+-binding EF-hand superfamily protein
MTRRRVIVGAAVLAGVSVVALRAQPPAQPQQPRPPAAPTQGQGQFDVRSFIAQFDRNRDGFLDINEVPQEMRAVFAQIDSNRDGKLSAEELQQFFARNPPQPPAPPLAEVVIDTALDAGRDANDLADLQRAYELMRLIDTNNDGRITADEARAARPRLIERRADAIIRGYDTDKDGRISRQEAKGQLAQDFDRLDSNRDGFVDKAELTRALTAQLAAPAAAPAATGQPPRPNTAPPPRP